MALGRCLLVTLIVLSMSACDNSQSAATTPVPPKPSTRPAEIPSADVLTLATEADMNAAAEVASDPAIQKAIIDHLGNSTRRWTIVAARPIGHYVLLWVSFPDVADGGIDLVYSTKEQRIGWEFKGGVRG